MSAITPCTCGTFAFTLWRPSAPAAEALRIRPLQVKVPSSETTVVQIVNRGPVETPVLKWIATVSPGSNPCPSTTTFVFAGPDDGLKVIAGPVTSNAPRPAIGADGSVAVITTSPVATTI